jgi:hypothetical protein
VKSSSFVALLASELGRRQLLVDQGDIFLSQPHVSAYHVPTAETKVFGRSASAASAASAVAAAKAGAAGAATAAGLGGIMGMAANRLAGGDVAKLRTMFLAALGELFVSVDVRSW